MKVLLLTPGTGSYHCGVCMRDNALARELIRQGHEAVMLPMYLPLTLDEDAANPGAPIFFGGVSTYLREKVPWLRHMPRWLDRLLNKPALLRLLARRAPMTGGPDVAEMTMSMLRGEEGNQASELKALVEWIREAGKPDAIWLSTALQAGLARELGEELHVPVIGFLQGEDTFLDGLGSGASERAWALLSERMRDADLWIAPSEYFAELMGRRLGWSEPERQRRLRVLPNGIGLEGYAPERSAPPTQPLVGYLARFLPGKGLGRLVDAFIELRRRGRIPEVRLRCAGSMTETDAKYVGQLQARLRAAGLEDQVEWLPNVSRAEKIAILENLTVFSVPALYSEAFGLYALEALAAGVPVVLPRASAFPELIVASGGGELFEPGTSESEAVTALADALESVLMEPARREPLAQAGWEYVRRESTMARFAQRLVDLTASMSGGSSGHELRGTPPPAVIASGSGKPDELHAKK